MPKDNGRSRLFDHPGTATRSAATSLTQTWAAIDLHPCADSTIPDGASLLEELRKAAEVEGVALNQLINVAVAEKVSALRTEEYFRERGRRADRAETLRILERAGQGNPPMEGDELPPEQRKKPGRKAANERDSAKRGQKKRAAVK